MNRVKRVSFHKLRIVAHFDYRYIYILGNTRHLFRYKIGITRNIAQRKRGIESSLAGMTYEIFAARFFYAHDIEQFMHSVYRPLNARMKGSGKTEWFWMLLPVSPTILLTLILLVQWILLPTFVACLAYIFLHRAELAEILF